jgi:Uma2 family endonuclease
MSRAVLSDYSEPEPDIAVLRRREPPYKEREAHSYAEARMAEYWVVDCTSEVVEIHRGPGPDGYREVRRFSVGAVVSPLAFPDLEVPLAEIFA